MLFRPVEIMFENMLIKERIKRGVNGKRNHILDANYAPIENEQSYQVANIISGTIPKDINGIYLRNGPNPKWIPENKSHHWFDGDAMIHALRIKNGQLYYCNRYMQCPRFIQENKAGKCTSTRIGELSYREGILKMLL